jgi:hypothetical protein
MKAKFTKKVSKIKPLPNPERRPPIGEVPDIPEPMDYKEMVEKARLATLENKVADDIRIKIV